MLFLTLYGCGGSSGSGSVNPDTSPVNPSPTNQVPTISLIGDADITLRFGATYSELGATAEDAEDGDLSGEIQISGDVVNSSVPGDYIISFEVTDSGNLSASVERTVTVLDNEPPTISLVGNSTIAMLFGAVYSELGAVASDPEDGDLTAQIQIAGDTVDPSISGNYLISYSITDSGGLSTFVERTITVSPNQPPAITLIGLATIYLDQDEDYVEQGASALDNEDGDLTNAIQIESNVDISTSGTYQVTYSVSDSAGASDQVERSVVVSEPEPDYCLDVDANARGIYDDIIQRWIDQDDTSPRREGSVVFAGSSSIRFWDALYQNFSLLNPIQRGFGGARIWDVAQKSEDLISRHSPAAVVIFASNSIPQGLTAEQTVEGYQCLVQQLDSAIGDIPIVYIGMTPVPARWDIWAEHDEANQAIQAITEGQPNLYYIDAPTEFLKTGSPPSLSLFQDDEIHLTDDGYQIWLDLLTPLLDTILPSPAAPPVSTLNPAGRILIDFGPSNSDDGTPTASPDDFGQTWNNWAVAEGGASIYAGESLGDLVDTSGNLTNVRLLITGEMESNGIQHGGLRNPTSVLLGNMAVDAATQDYIYAIEGQLGKGSLSMTGLDQDATYTLRLFASRDDTETRVTRYVVSGASDSSPLDLQTSGNGIGEAGNGNDQNIAEFSGIQPDAAGTIHIDLSAEEGSFAYLSILELVAE